MQQTDFNRFKAIMAGMAKLYDKELEPILLDAYWMALRDWTLDDFEAAAGQLMRTQTFMPRPAEFTALRKQARRVTAAEAWFTSGTSDDDRANRAMKIAAQGRYVGHIPIDELHWVQKRFVEIYDELDDIDEARAAIGGPPRWEQIVAPPLLVQAMAAQQAVRQIRFDANGRHVSGDEVG